jgi:nicotinamidase-related amidase
MAQKSPDGSVLLVIDMQNDFIFNESSPVYIEGSVLCLPSVVWAVQCARENNVPVIWVVREHEPSGILTINRFVEITNSHTRVVCFLINSLVNFLQELI